MLTYVNIWSMFMWPGCGQGKNKSAICTTAGS